MNNNCTDMAFADALIVTEYTSKSCAGITSNDQFKVFEIIEIKGKYIW